MTTKSTENKPPVQESSLTESSKSIKESQKIIDPGIDDLDSGNVGLDEGSSEPTGKYVKMDERDHLNIVFIGHVDAGKSTLGGQILYSKGYVDERTIEMYKREAKEKNRESWFLAYILDLGEEEREKGKTTDVSRAFFETEKKRYTILDAPGHSLYVPNMIAGTSQADVAVLVISAKKGEFESGFEKTGQTREHATLAKTLGVRKLIVAINKMDDETVRWDKHRYDSIVEDLSSYLRTIGWDLKKSVSFLPICALSGTNVCKKIEDKDLFPSYTGSSLLDVLDSLELKHPYVDAPLRIPIIDRYKDRGLLIAFGKIESGSMKRGDKVVVMPSKLVFQVARIKLHAYEVDIAKSGENVQLFLKSPHKDFEISNGSVICNIENPLQPVEEFLGQFLVQDTKPIFSAGYRATLQIHTVTVPVTITSLISKLDKKGEKEPGKPDFAKAGGVYIAKMKAAMPICIEKFDVISPLGRFSLREEKTIAVGKIIGIKPMTQSTTEQQQQQQQQQPIQQ